jgi:hypothetical protein
MSKLTQEFFWTPDELIRWIQRVCGEADLWLVVWRVGRNADIVSPEVILPSWFEGVDDSVQFFIGDPALCSVPQWRIVGDRRELDFTRSHAIQLVPSLVAPDGRTLLQGRLAIMRASDYDDTSKYAELSKLNKPLRSDLQRNADSGRVDVQPLSIGGRKRWAEMLVSSAVAGSNAKLKQFFKSEVEFELEPA